MRMDDLGSQSSFSFAFNFFILKYVEEKSGFEYENWICFSTFIFSDQDET
jgi:hypothetical protein